MRKYTCMLSVFRQPIVGKRHQRQHFILALLPKADAHRPHIRRHGREVMDKGAVQFDGGHIGYKAIGPAPFVAAADGGQVIGRRIVEHQPHQPMFGRHVVYKRRLLFPLDGAVGAREIQIGAHRLNMTASINGPVSSSSPKPRFCRRIRSG